MKEEIKEGYKKTEIGVIPEEWEVKRLGDIGNLKGGNGFKVKYQGMKGLKYPFYKVNDMNTKGNEIFMKYAEHTIDENTKNILKCYVFSKNTIVFAKVGAALLLNRRRILITPSCIDNNMMGYEVNNGFYKYIFYVLQTIDFGKFVNEGAVPSINQEQVGNIKIPLPPLKEQLKIASILSTVDEHIEQTDKLIEKTKELKKGLMQKLLTKGIGHTEFKNTEIGEIPKEWEVSNLGNMFKLSSGKFLSQKSMTKGIYAVYGGNGISGYHNKYLFEESKIVIGRVGANCGCVYISEPKAWITDNALYISEKLIEFDDKYMFYLLNYKDLNSLANQNAQPVISRYKIYDVKVPLIPLEEQKKIASILSVVDNQIEQYELKKEKLQTLKKGLMQQLLTGKIRVKV